MARRRTRRRNKTLRKHDRERSRPGFQVLDLLLSLPHHFSILSLLLVDSFAIQNERWGVLDVEQLVLGGFFWGSFGLDFMGGGGGRESKVGYDEEEEEDENAEELLQGSIETHERR